MEIRVRMRQDDDGRWVAEALGDQPMRATGSSADKALTGLRRRLPREPGSREQVIFIVESIPRLAGVAEAAAVMGWDKRRVITYIDRGRFPKPIESLASGRVWIRSDVEEFARDWHARQARRRGKR